MTAISLPITVHSAGQELPAATVAAMAQILNAVLPVGVLIDFYGLESQVQGGMLPCSGKTVGNASSNATARANADMEELFAHLWAVGNSEGTLSIYTSAGSGSTFGANAAADWAANKAIALPDFRGKVSGGKDNQGGTSANVITDAAADKIGGAYGEAAHTLTTPEIPSHNHTFQIGAGTPNQSGSITTGLGSTMSSVSTPNNQQITSTGGGGSHNNVQPTVFVEKIIWTGATW